MKLRWANSMRSAARLGCIGATVFALGFSGCTKLAPEDAANVLRISQRNEPVDLDPATAVLPDEFFVIRALSEGLLVPNPAGGAPLPAAASTYDISPDGLVYTFHLRDGAIWSNGDPVTAGDFVASYRRVLTPGTAAPKAHLFFTVRNAEAFVTGTQKDFSQVGLRAPDPLTLVVTLAHPLTNFPLLVASGPWIPVNPRIVERFGRHWTQPEHYVGNGPFVLLQWRPQQQIVVGKNARYRDAEHVMLEKIRFVRFDNQDSEERSFRGGQIDVTMAVPQTKLATYAQSHPDELNRSALAETRFLAFNLTRAPLSDVRVRRALTLAIDRETLVTDVLRGGQLPAWGFLSPALLLPGLSRAAAAAESSHPGQPDAPNAVRFDPMEARRLLAEAGFPDGRGFPRLELAGWDRNPVIEAIQQMWKRELSIEVRIAIREAKVHLTALEDGNYDIAFATNLLDVRDPIVALGDFVGSAPNNFPHWRSAEYDRLVSVAADEHDNLHARDEIEAAESLLLRDAPIAPIYFNVQNWLISPRVHGWEQDAIWNRRYNDVRIDPAP